MSGSDCCAATRPSRARQAAKSNDASTEAGATPPPCQTGGAGRDAARRAALVRTAFSFAMEARCIRKGDGKGAAAQGETGAAAGRTEWESGRALGMEERMMAGPGGGNGENGRESGRVRTGQDEEESGRAWRGACRGRGNGAMTRGKRACAGVDRGKGVRAAAGGGWTRADGGQTGKRGGPPGTKNAPLLYKTTRRARAKKRTPALQKDPAGVRKNSAPLLCKATRRACAKKAHSCFTKRPGGRAQKSALLLCKRTQRACAKNAPLLYKNGPARAKKARPCVKQGRAAGLRPPSPSGGSAARRASAC